jgi:excisionase family DNA binding protein
MNSQYSIKSIIETKSEFLTRKQAAKYLGISPGTLAVWGSTKRYDLFYIKMGSHAKYRKSDLDTFIESRDCRRVELKKRN